MSYDLTPLAVAELLLGDIGAVASACGFGAKTPFHWRKAGKYRDAGDFPSLRVQRALLDYSDQRGLGLTPEHVIRGGRRAEIEAILANRPSGQRMVAAE